MYVHEHPSNSPFLYEAEGRLTREGVAYNAAVIDAELQWLREIIRLRFPEINGYTGFNGDHIDLPEPPLVTDARGPYSALIQFYGLSAAERFLLIFTLAPRLDQRVQIPLYMAAVSGIREVIQGAAGFVKHDIDRFIGTFGSVIHLLAGHQSAKKLSLERLLLHDSQLLIQQIIEPQEYSEKSPALIPSERLPRLAEEYAAFLLHGQPPRPDFGENFPAKLVSTNLDWHHLVVQKATRDEVNWAMQWVSHGRQFTQRAGNKVNKSFPILFSGPPGTGKSLTAKLIGKQFGKLVFRIDLSMMVSKYIGETEKNLARLFDRAQGKDWILFFDEADSLFSKRTQVNDSHDKWANLETSYLLQRIEEYDGLCILATNLRDNIDAAMLRRFQYTIHFPRPTQELREQLWKTLLPDGYEFDVLDFRKLCVQDLTGANIANVLNHACLAAEADGRTVLKNSEIVQFMALELMKENRTLKSTDHIK
ncbi:MAG: ATP-binding protein [Bacteroidia bacterium]|jgi:AAA+ superfamily predicted ATPase|nr:ATP-binding protein [Bacteroidia bacterium]